MNFFIANSIMVLLSISSSAMAVFFKARATGNTEVLPVPDQGKSFSIICGESSTYDKSYLKSSVEEGLRHLGDDSRGRSNFPMINTDFIYKVDGINWAYPILHTHQVYLGGLVDNDFVVFNSEGIILGGLHLDKASSTVYPCKFPDQTVFMP